MDRVKEVLKDIVEELYSLPDFEVSLVTAPKDVGADYSSNVAMVLAREVHKNPMEIAHEMVKVYEESEVAKEFEVEIAAPGFLNFISSDAYFIEKIGDFGTNFVKNISLDDMKGQTVICEFSDPNPFKVLHVGHLYTSIVGDAISRLQEFAGAKVVRVNFGGDVGLHVGKTLWAVMKRGMTPEELTIEKIAECYVEGTRAYEEGAPGFLNDELGVEGGLSVGGDVEAEFGVVEGVRAELGFGGDSEASAKAEIQWINKKIYEIAAAGPEAEGVEPGVVWGGDGAMEAGTRGIVERLGALYWQGRNLSYQYFDDFYARIGVKFDKYYPESTVAGRGLEAVQEGLEKGVYEESDGAVVFRGEKYGLHTRVFINKNGLPTYEAKDVGLILTKWEDYRFDKSVVITGNDIIDYMKVVLKSVEQFAPELVERTVHLTHGNVRLPGNEKMSSRKGNFLRAVDVLDAVNEELWRVVNGSGDNENGDSEVTGDGLGVTGGGSEAGAAKKMTVDRRVALGAVKYAFLKYKVGGNIEFDVKKSVSMTGNSGPYLQYSTVRAQKILTNIMKNGVAKGDDEWELDIHERTLIKKIIQYPEALKGAVLEMMPSKICTYLYEVSQEFSRFYENVKVAGSKFEFERGQIVLAYLKVMTHGLNLLGIEVPEKM